MKLSRAVAMLIALLPAVSAAGTWTKREVSVPRPDGYPPSYEWEPTGLTLVYDSWRRVTVGLGGGPYYHFAHLPVAEFNGVAWVNRTGYTAESPSYRSLGSAAFDSRRGVTVIYGGFSVSGSTVLDDLWEYDGNNWTRRTWSGPGPRPTSAAKLCFDPVRGRTTCLTNSPLTDVWETWEWTGQTWDRGPDLAGVRNLTTEMVFDEARKLAFVYTSAGNFETTWELLPGNTALAGAWRHVPNAGAPVNARTGSSLVYDFHRQRILRQGGREITIATGFTNATFEWNADESRWRLFDSMSGDPRGGSGICYDRSRAVSVLYGGTRVYTDSQGVGRRTEYTETWEYSDPAPNDRWLDFAWSGAETGSPAQPWNTLNEAFALAPANGIVWLKGANTAVTIYSAALRSLPLTLRAWDGPVTIGP
jgi:hypothetical protein